VDDTDFVGSATLVAVTVAFVLAVAGEGAVYTPARLTLPGPATDHVTAVFGLCVIDAVNCCVCPDLRFALEGLIDIDKGPSDTVADADLVGSIVLVAVTFTLVCEGTAAGAV